MGIFLENGRLSLEDIKRRFHVIDERGYHNFVLMEHNKRGEDYILCVNFKSNTYCETWEDLDYTVNNREEFTWRKMRVEN